MAYWIDLKTVKDSRGTLTVIDNILPYEVKRIYYIYNVTERRGGHRHKKCIQGLVSIKGKLEVFCDDGSEVQTYILNDPSKVLIIEPKDWHFMEKFSEDAVLLVLSSEHYDLNDYIDEPYPPR